MTTHATAQGTDFTRDVIGRYVCNGFDEALASTDRSRHPDARPFDLIVLGGGTFGPVLASHLFTRDVTHAHRILVLEAGPVVFTEHVQNQPMLSTNEVWGVPWNSDSPKGWNQQFPGLAFCVGGRSLFWGGWSPYFIDSELPSPPWPAGVVEDLTQPVVPVGTRQLSYLDEAAEQIGTAATNDFVFGPLHSVLRDVLFTGLKSRPKDPRTTLAGNRGTVMNARKPEAELKQELEAPLAVESAATRPGTFPFNKFNAMQLLIRASRLAQAEAEQSAVGDPETISVKKRLMVVANCHVIQLERSGTRITRVITNQGVLDVPAGGQVAIALGTIESTRLALNTLPNREQLIGRNLMAHLRSNLTIRINRANFGSLLDPVKNPELQVSALFVKGIHTHDDGSPGHFHIQLTASGLGDLGMDSEAELFKKIPDVDTLDKFQNLTDEWIVITLRGIGEMVGDKTAPNPQNRIALGGSQGAFDFGMPRAMVRLEPGPKDLTLWDVVDQTSDEVARMLANGGPLQYLSAQSNGVWQDTPPGPDARRDTLSSTHHESGTLWMGEDPMTSVTDPWGRFHEAENLYAVGPALLPTMGSPNPMLSGVALGRRLADHLVPIPNPAGIEPGFTSLFDGTEGSFNAWHAVGEGAFALVDGSVVAQPGSGLGLLYYARQPFGDFTLRLQFRLDRLDDNSGVFVRFRDPRRPVPDRTNPAASHAYTNQAWVGVDTGFEVQIDEQAKGDPQRGIPDGLDTHRTGAIYNIDIGPTASMQGFHRGPVLEAGRWNDYEIDVQGDTYTVRLNGKDTTTFSNKDAYRGKSATVDPLAGYLGLQAHTGQVAFRMIRVKRK
jgi:hypothetical protein